MTPADSVENVYHVISSAPGFPEIPDAAMSRVVRMSGAAEKLEALARAREGYFGVGHSSDFALMDALPQIVALVEAAEEIVKYGEQEFREGERAFQFVLLARAALAALNEALS